MSKFCPQCGKEVGEKTSFCPYCGIEIRPGTRSFSDATGNPRGEASLGEKKAIASLVLGIVACFFAWFGLGGSITSIAAGIIGLSLGVSARTHDGFTSGYRTAGWILSLIGLICGGFMFVVDVLYLAWYW